jgi:hypothetical protein
MQTLMSMLFFTLYDLAFQAELAFSYAYSMSKSNETIMRQTLKLVKLKKSMQIITDDLYSFLAEYPLEEKLSKEVDSYPNLLNITYLKDING